ncbi:hypothetical protein [Haloglomus litoreum]|uniref:hypothetical protein n=1 Tax=Haloglomus litoreum TaxID=3034026 RepID=UPI0023E7D499|nr:hypothetical protein [Haloglomus sp. DT116]
MALTAVLHLGARPPLGGGLDTSHVVHCHEDGVPRFLAYELEANGDLSRVPGAYAPDLDADPSYPVTDLLLALRRDGSAAAQRLDVLDTKARANYGAGFRRKVFDSDVEWGSDGYGRHFEARSQLESHPYDGAVVVGFHVGASEAARLAIADNLSRLDAETGTFRAAPPDETA